MKRLLLVFLGSVILKGNALAANISSLTSKKGVQEGTPIKSIKVSEINANLFSSIYDFIQESLSSLLEGFVFLKDFVETGEWVIASLQNPEMREQVGIFSLELMLALFVAFVFSQGLSSWLKPKMNAFLLCSMKTPHQKVKSLLLAVLLSIVPPLVFGFLLYTLFRLLNPYDGVYLEIIRFMSSGSATIWILLNLSHLFLRPPTSDHQHLPFSKDVLSRTYVWIRRMAFVALFGFFAHEAGALIYLPSSGERLILQGTAFAIAIMAIFMIFTLRLAVKDWIVVEKANPKLSKLKRGMLPYLEYSYIPFFVFIAISYISWLAHEMDSMQLIIWKVLFTVALLPFLHYGSYCLRKFRLLYLHRNLRRYSKTFSERGMFYGRQIDFVMTVVIYGMAILFTLNLWGFNPSFFLFSKLGRLIAEKAISIFVIISVALFITRLGNGLLTKYLNAERGALDDTQKQRVARFKTIFSVSRNVLRIAVWTPAILLIIVEMDVDIMPILVSVGVLSVGLSFGVQSLVKDLVTGFFMLLEDAFAVNDLMVINGQMGRIESLTVRVVRLRATDGSLYTFPYGNITSICNQNRDFSAAVMLFQVGIEADIDQVFEIIEKISRDLRKDPSTRQLVVGSVEISGVNEVNDHAIEIRAILKTKPSEHYKIKWAFNRLLKQYLKSANIPLATPRNVAFNYAVEK